MAATKGRFDHERKTRGRKGGMMQRARAFGRPHSAGTHGQETQDESQMVLYQCRDDLMALWNDRTVRDILRKRKVRLEERPGL